MGIQSSINSLLSQAQSLATFYRGFKKAGDFIKGQDNIIKGQKEQTEATKSLQEAFENKKKEEFYNEMFDQDGKLSRHGEEAARLLQYRINRGIKLDSENNEFYNSKSVQEYLKSFNENKAAKVLANQRVINRTDSINQSKSDFDEHTASLIKKYGKGSENP